MYIGNNIYKISSVDVPAVRKLIIFPIFSLLFLLISSRKYFWRKRKGGEERSTFPVRQYMNIFEIFLSELEIRLVTNLKILLSNSLLNFCV